jgi:phosphonate transport system substrate-binding protein
MRVLVFIFGFTVFLFGYTVAIVPQFKSVVIEKNWAPVIAAISADSGIPLSIKYYKKFPDFENALSKGEIDFAYMNPYYSVMYKKEYTPIIKDSSQKLNGILVVRKDSPYKTIKDLAGKRIAFPAPNAFGASLLIRAALGNKEKISYTTVYASSHSNTYRLVLTGDCDAGGGVNKTLAQEDDAVKSSLRIIYETISTNPHPFCANKKLDIRVVKKIQNSFLALTKTENGKAQLRAIEISLPVEADYEKDYKELENLNFDKFVVKSGNK